MPTMVRPEDKARKIAWKILGVPANIAYKKSKEQKDIDQKLMWDETARVR